MQIRPTAFTIGLIIYSFIALFFVYTEFGIDSKKIREQFIDAPTIVPLNVPQQQRQSEIRIGKNDLQISLPSDIDPETLLSLVKALC